MEYTQGNDENLMIGKKDDLGNEIVEVGKNTFLIKCSDEFIKTLDDFVDGGNGFSVIDGVWHLKVTKHQINLKHFK